MQHAEYTFEKMDEVRARWVLPRVYAAPRPLRPYLDACFETRSGPERVPGERARRMPEGAAYVVFLKDRIVADGGPESMVVFGGAHDRVHDIPAWDYASQFGIRVRPGAAALIAGCPAAELTNTIVPLRELWGARADRLFEELMATRCEARCLELLSAAITEKVSQRSDEDLQTVRLAAAVRSQSGDARIADLARNFGVSVRTLERRFRDGVGLSPKQYQRVSRLACVLEAVNRDVNDWAGVANACGYYDQSHLIEDCHAVVGCSPDRFLRRLTQLASLEIGLVFERPPAAEEK